MAMPNASSSAAQAGSSSRSASHGPAPRLNVPQQACPSSPGRSALISHEELTDLRALQRTFDGAYTRTALAQLSYAVLILRLFEHEFYWCGLVYTVLAVQLIGIATYRYRLTVQNQDRWSDVKLLPKGAQQETHGEDAASTAGDTSTQRSADVAADDSGHVADQPLDAHHLPLFRPTFRTAGSVVALATFPTLCLEIVLAGLVIAM